VSAVERLAALLHAEGGLLAATLARPPQLDEVLDGLPADEPGLVLAAVREGYLLHYGEGRVVRTQDPELALLGGDRLYALGLARLAETGDLEAVAQLADLISDCARAHAEGDVAAAEAAWRAAASSCGR
jgi:hypothetical protein